MIPGYIGDKMGPVNVYMLCTLLTGMTMLCWAAVRSVPSMYAWTVVYGFIVGGVQSVFPSGLTSLTEDPRKQGTRMGMVCTIVSFATLTGSPISGAIINFQGGKYLGAQMFAGVAMLMAAVFIALARMVKTRRQGHGILSVSKV